MPDPVTPAQPAAATPQPLQPAMASASHDGFEVTSNHATEAELGAALKGDAPTEVPAAPAPTEPAPVAPADDADDDVEEPPAQSTVDLNVSEAARVLAGKKSTLKARKESYQAQIDDLARQRGDSERARDAVRVELAELEKRKTAVQAEMEALAKPPQTAGSEKVTPPRPIRPKLKDFDDLDAYHEALDKHFESLETWQLDRAREHAAEESQKIITQQREDDAKTRADDQNRAAYQQMLASHQQRVEDFKKTHPDFEERVYAPSLPIVPPMAHAIQRSPYGPHAAYYLSAHPDEARRIALLAPADIFQEMGKLFWKMELEASPAPSTVPGTGATQVATTAQRPPVASSVPTVAVQSVSQASPPVKTLGAAPVAADDGPPPDSAPWEVHQKYWDNYDRKRKQQGIR